MSLGELLYFFIGDICSVETWQIHRKDGAIVKSEVFRSPRELPVPPMAQRHHSFLRLNGLIYCYICLRCFSRLTPCNITEIMAISQTFQFKASSTWPQQQRLTAQSDGGHRYVWPNAHIVIARKLRFRRWKKKSRR